MSGPEMARMRATMERRSTLCEVSSLARMPVPFAFGRRSASTREKRMRIGTATASPNAMASPLPMEEMKLVVEDEELGIAERMISWSCSLARRMAKTVEHWERIVGSSSPGRWVTMPSETPYLRPSLAMRAMAWRVGVKPSLGSAGT